MAEADDKTAGVRDEKMYRPPPQQDDQPVRLSDIWERIKSSLPAIPGFGGGGTGALFLLILAGAVVIWLSTGFYTVGPDQQGAIRTFGKFTGTSSQGLHWYWPAPIGTLNVVRVTTTRRMELGFRSGADSLGPASSRPEESLMITGDENIVDVQAVIQYRISNLVDYLFKVDDPGEADRGVHVGQPDGRTLRDVAETALRQVVGTRPIDDVLTTQKEQVQTEVLLKMRELLGRYETGIEVLQVLLQNVNPPRDVQDAFEDVVRAREDRERAINLAEAYKADQLPKATGQARRIVEEAQGFSQGRIARAKGEADGFKAVLEGYRRSPDVTRQRLYLEAMEEVLPGIKKFIISDQSVLPLLPLGQSASTPAPTATPQQAPAPGARQ
jgi:membrane protease subunit HflK